MIYITGDTHAGFKYRFNAENFPEQKEMTDVSSILKPSFSDEITGTS